MGNWQKWLSSWAKWWNITDQSQPNPLSDQMDHPVEGDRVRSILSLIVASDDRIAVSSPTGCSFDFQEERVPDTACVGAGADAPTPRTYVSQSHFHKFPLWGRINYFNGGRARVREDGSRILISGSGTCSAGAVGADG